MEEDEAEVESVALVPAYVSSGPDVVVGPGVHCSMHPEDFCFFCMYEKNTDASSAQVDLYGALCDMVRHMADLKREPSAIARHVATSYTQTVQLHVEGRPDWTVRSITRHIMYAGQFNDVFDTSVGAMFTALIARQNAMLVDATTGAVIEENRRAFCDTIQAFVKWRSSNKRKA